MIVDVMDINFSKLQFNRQYDAMRNKRGKNIYINGNVAIKQIDQIDNKVKSYVDGNYGYYAVNLSIKDDRIYQSSCTCEDCRNGYLCKHIIATSMELMAPHSPSTEEGRKKIEQKRREEAERRMELLKKRREEERKRQEYELKYRNGLHTINLYKNENSAIGTKNILNLPELYEEVKMANKQKIGTLADSIKIEFNLEFQDAKTLKLSVKLGQTCMYVLNSITKFYEAYQNEEELYYGKQLRFIPKRENFCKESQRKFDFIIQYAEMIDYNNKFNHYRIANTIDKEMLISGDKIEEIFDMMDEKKIIANSYTNGRNEYWYTEESLDIECVLEKEMVKNYVYHDYYYWQEKEEAGETEEYVFKLNISNYYVLISKQYIYILCNHKIYRKGKEIELVKLLNLFDKQEEILIPEDKLNEFKKFVLPKMKYMKEENLPVEMVQEGIIVNTLASKILLDIDEKGNILLELKFCYPNYEFNVLETEYKKEIKEKNIIRDIPAETEVIKKIFADGFQLISGRKQFIMQNTDNIYEFLTQKIEGYMKDFEVMATDSFKNKQIRQPKISSIGVKVDNGLLELDISKINIDISEIKDILKDYNIKKKYHRLKNGDFLNLTNNESLDLLDEMVTTLDIDYNKGKNGIVNLPINKSIYLEKLMNHNKKIDIKKNKEFVSLINNIENFGVLDNIKIDKHFENILRDYQKTGYKWMRTLGMYKFGGILADDMGLGKTLQVISLLKASLNEEEEFPSIVVCPSTLVLNWQAEIEKWCNELKVLIIKGNAEVRKELIARYQNYNLVITSYDLLKRDVEEYEGKKFKYIIADEAQYIKNSSTQNATSLKSLDGEVKFALTGTPIENSIAELWSIFDFIMPGYLYSYNKFKKKFEEPIIKEEDKNALNRLKKMISPFILRRIKTDVLTELPEKNITIMKNEMEEEQEKLYLSYMAQTKKEIAEELSENSFEKSKFKILMLLTRLRQICCHPSLFIENYKGTSGKLKQCMDLISEAINSGHKILLFSSYTSMFEIIEKELKKVDIQYYKLDGNTPVNTRIEMVDQFNDNKDIKIFLISLKAGGTGLNLTSADVVIHYDPWWNISSENQATDRAYRIGQKNSVQVYKLITNNSIEEKINKMQERKEKLSKDLLTTEETFINKLSKQEILDLFE